MGDDLDNISNYPSYLIAKNSGLVESGVIPLCDALFKIGAKPLASCEGHSKINGKTQSRSFFVSLLVRLRFLPKDEANWLPPYVMFSSSSEVAATINKAIEAAPCQSVSQMTKRSLFFVWNVCGHFGSENKLVWIIKPNDYRLRVGSHWLHMNDVGVSEKLIRDDIVNIANLILNELPHKSNC